jgi:hypothetical protein
MEYRVLLRPPRPAVTPRPYPQLLFFFSSCVLSFIIFFFRVVFLFFSIISAALAVQVLCSFVALFGRFLVKGFLAEFIRE